MKKIIPFSKYFVPTTIGSSIVILFGIIGYIIFTTTGAGGFNMGIDFQAGLIQEIQFAPSALSLTYTGAGNASIEFNQNALAIVLSGSGVEEATHRFSYAQYATVGDLSTALEGVSGIHVSQLVAANTPTGTVIESTQGSPQLGSTPFPIHYLPAGAEPIGIERVRESLSTLGTVSVQVLGEPADRRFMIRMDDKDVDGKDQDTRQTIIRNLEENFGQGGVAVTSARYVESRFSQQLASQAGILITLTLLLILGYAAIRFKLQFAIGAVLAIAHDALVMVAFIVWSRMEFNTTTIAAILTILGYSINDTIVIFDRIRETRRIYPEDPLPLILDRSITETLSRTVITTLTTMLAVLSLYIFTTGSMKDFALALLVGMISGVYSTIFIASGFVMFWEVQTKKKTKQKTAPVKVALAKA
ncbi:protein-export membrane protein SecF [Spirochaetia bacterium]|nr:protein-export membrane protein SecF [Spirochaetia bacterium]